MNKRARHPEYRGFTVLEVLVSLFILLTVLPSIMHLLLTGDRINLRRQAISHAAMLASNQVETIRKQPDAAELMGDTVYDAEMNGHMFEIRRVRMSPPLSVRPDTVINYLEFSVTVKRKSDTTALVNFRLLQGFNGKQPSSGTKTPFMYP
jgi:type II secretory pathway pseudopilin PulG